MEDSAKPPLPPISNETFDGEIINIELKTQKCDHNLVRKTSTTVECDKCHNGWIDMGMWTISNGAIASSDDQS